MAQGNNAQTVAYQYERVFPKISLLFMRDHILWDKIKREVPNLSSRATRIPLDILAGGNFSQVNPDGGDAGLGSAITADFGQVSSVYFAHATQFTKLFEWATDANQKAIEPAAKRNLTVAIDQMRKGLEGLLNTDGSGTLDTVVSTSGTAVLNVNNPNQFFDNQIIGVFNPTGPVQRGTSVQIQSVDANAKTLTLTGAFPVGTTANDLLVVSGATGVAASSLLGIKYHQSSSTTGTWLQLARATYPGKLYTPNVSLANASITPQVVRLGEAQLKRRLGIDTPEVDDLMWHMNVDQVAAWENVGLIVTQVIQNQLGGSESEDMLKKSQPKTMAGRPIIESLNATPGRIDGLCLKHWCKTVTKPIGPLEFGGQTMFPTYGASGGVNFSTVSYLVWGGNVVTDNPGAGVIFTSCASPSGY